MHADRHLYYTAGRDRLVEAGDPAAAFLAYAPGDEITDADAAQVKKAGKPADKQAGAARSKQTTK